MSFAILRSDPASTKEQQASTNENKNMWLRWSELTRVSAPHGGGGD
jgi:hypothetical protein